LLYFGIDAPFLAQRLSEKYQFLGSTQDFPDDASRTVFLSNAACSSLLGNHWHGYGAESAIDENLHRRSPLLAAVSLVLNEGATRRVRVLDELAD